MVSFQGLGEDHRKTKEKSVRVWFPAGATRVMSVRTRFCGQIAWENDVSQAKWDLRKSHYTQSCFVSQILENMSVCMWICEGPSGTCRFPF